MRRLAAVLVVPLLALGLMACGGDDDDSATAGTDGSSSSGGSASGSGFCKEAKNVDQEFNDLGSATSGGIPSSDVFEKAADALDKLAKDAPSEIRTDMKTVASGVRRVAEAIGDLDLSDPQALTDPANAERFQQMSDEMESLGQEIQAASDRVARYLADECGIDLDTSTSEATTTTAG